MLLSPSDTALTGRIYTSRGAARCKVPLPGSGRLGPAAVAVAVPVAAAALGGRLLGRRLVLLGGEALVAALVVAAGLRLGAGGVVGRGLGRGRTDGRRRRDGVVGAVGRVALAAAAGRVAAEERLRDERRLGRREVAAELALGHAHVRVPDLRRERGAGHVGAVVEPEHLRAVIGIADPYRGRQPRREAHEPRVGELVRGARLARHGAVDVRRGAGAAGHVLLEDLGRLGGDAVLEGPGPLDLPARGQLLAAVGEGHARDRRRPVAIAAGGDRRVGVGHLERRDAVGEAAERLRRVAVELGADAEVPGGLLDLVGADVERELDVDRVVREQRRLAQRDEIGRA